VTIPQLHGPYPVAVKHGERVFTVPAARGWCSGRCRLLYSRRSNPQRWVAVGAYCDGCGKATALSDKRLADERDAAAAALQ